MEKGIRKFASRSDLMDIKVEWENTTFKFNLYEELGINEVRLNQEAMEQPSSYAFINMLWKKLALKVEEYKAIHESVRGKEYLRYKQKIQPETGRPYNDDMAKACVDSSVKVGMARNRYFQIKNQASILEVCVKAFEMRSNLIQTLSANVRKNNP